MPRQKLQSDPSLQMDASRQCAHNFLSILTTRQPNKQGPSSSTVRQKFVGSYVIETSPDPVTPTTWTNRTVPTKSSITIGGLTSGSRCWFHVAAVNPAGQSGWSDPATKIVP